MTGLPPKIYALLGEAITLAAQTARLQRHQRFQFILARNFAGIETLNKS